MSEDASTCGSDVFSRVEKVTGYIFGHMSESDADFPTLAVVSPTADGWRVRSTNRGYNHDYVCYETFEEIMQWIDIDMYRPFVAIDRQEAVRTLVHTGAEHCTGFLFPGDVPAGSAEEADAVVSHLEGGWY